MKSRADLARGWFQKGDSDRHAAIQVLATSGPYDTACFHAQQAAEKYLKGYLTFNQVRYPFSHDVAELARLCLTFDSALEIEPAVLATLTSYAAALRYDAEFWPDAETAEEALDLASGLRSTLLAALPVITRPPQSSPDL